MLQALNYVKITVLWRYFSIQQVKKLSIGILQKNNIKVIALLFLFNMFMVPFCHLSTKIVNYSALRKKKIN